MMPSKLAVVGVLAALVAIADDHLLALLGIEQVVERLGRELGHRNVGIPAMGPGDGFHDLAEPRVGHRHPRPRPEERPLGDRQRLVRHDQIGVDLEARPETGAVGAGTMGRVEREAARLELVDDEVVVRTRVALGVAALLEGRGLVRRSAPGR